MSWCTTPSVASPDRAQVPTSAQWGLEATLTSEALFRTPKYQPRLPVKPQKDLLQACRWVSQLMHWYNQEHRHSAIGFVTPLQHYPQVDRSLLSNRIAVYAAARDWHRRRWSGATRTWTRIEEVAINPEKPNNHNILADRKAA